MGCPRSVCADAVGIEAGASVSVGVGGGVGAAVGPGVAVGVGAGVADGIPSNAAAMLTETSASLTGVGSVRVGAVVGMASIATEEVVTIAGGGAFSRWVGVAVGPHAKTKSVGNQHKWDSMGPERSGVW